MKKVVLTVLVAFALVIVITSCEKETTETYDEIHAIDNKEVDDDEI